MAMDDGITQDNDTRAAVLDERDMIADRQHETLRRYMKVILWVTVILFITTLMRLVWYYQVEEMVSDLNTKTEFLTNETEATQKAAIEARDSLQAALAEIEERRESGESADPTAIRDALVAVYRIETHLCGGPCPVDGG